MPRSRWLWFLVGLATALLAAPSRAAMQLERNVVYFDADSGDRQDVLVRNPDPEPLYVEAETLEVLRPGEPDEERIRIHDPRSMGLLVTPTRLVVPPGGQRRVRFVHLGEPGAVDKVFRVNLTPKIGELKARSSGIKVLVAFQVLVIVAPDQRHNDLLADRVRDTVEFENRGNSNVLLYRGVQCPDPGLLDTPDRTGCRPVRGTRLYAGNRWQPTLPYTTPVEFVVKSSNRNVRQRF